MSFANHGNLSNDTVVSTPIQLAYSTVDVIQDLVISLNYYGKKIESQTT